MGKDAIIIQFAEDRTLECSSAVIIPERAIDEAGYIRTMTVKASAHSKHEFHALAQMVYYQVQDGELAVEFVQGPIAVVWQEDQEILSAGMVIAVDVQGGLHLIAQEGQNIKKLLEATNRFCTRWVRLDI